MCPLWHHIFYSKASSQTIMRCVKGLATSSIYNNAPIIGFFIALMEEQEQHWVTQRYIKKKRQSSPERKARNLRQSWPAASCQWNATPLSAVQKWFMAEGLTVYKEHMALFQFDPLLVTATSDGWWVLPRQKMGPLTSPRTLWPAREIM